MKKITVVLLSVVLGASLLLGACSMQTESNESIAVAPEKDAYLDSYTEEEPMASEASMADEEAGAPADEWGIAGLENAVLPETDRKTGLFQRIYH